MQRMRAWRGPAVFSYGFRPFFLIAGGYAALVILVWLLVLTGNLPAPGAWPPLAWHSHELVFGFLPAVIAGFLLTAVPNWTGRLPVVGWPLAGLVAVWVAGRIAVAASGFLPGVVVAATAVAFPITLAAVLDGEHSWPAATGATCRSSARCWHWRSPRGSFTSNRWSQAHPSVAPGSGLRSRFFSSP